MSRQQVSKREGLIRELQGTDHQGGMVSKVRYLGKLVRSLEPAQKTDVAYECEEVSAHRFAVPEEAAERTEEQRAWWHALSRNRCPLCTVEREGP